MPPVNTTALRNGAIAQLGERLHGMQEVSGSIPLSSTNIQTLAFSGGFFMPLISVSISPLSLPVQLRHCLTLVKQPFIIIALT